MARGPGPEMKNLPKRRFQSLSGKPSLSRPQRYTQRPQGQVCVCVWYVGGGTASRFMAGLPVWPKLSQQYRALLLIVDYTPARPGAAIYFGTSLNLLVMMSIVALHLFFSKAGPRRGRLLHSSLSTSRCGDLAMAPPDLFWAGVPASGGAGIYYHFNFPRLRDRRLGDAAGRAFAS